MDTHMIQTAATGFRAAAAQTPDWVEARDKLVAAQGMLGRLPERDLFNLMRRAAVRTVRPRKSLFRYGDPAAAVIAVLDGHVKLSTTTVGGREVVLDIVPPGGCIGELAVFNNWPRDADAVTVTRSRLLFIDGRQFLQVLERSTEASQAMLRLLSQQLRSARQQAVDMVVLPAPARLAKALLTLARLSGPVARDGTKIELRLSQAELGGMTGLTRESINKNLAALRDAGWIALEGGAVTLLDVAALDSLPREHEGRRPGQASIYPCRDGLFHPPTAPRKPFPDVAAARRAGFGVGQTGP